MRKLLAALVTVAAGLVAVPAMAQDRVVIVDTDRDGPTAEIGVMAGFPTGLTGKAWIDDTNAVEVGLGFVPAIDTTIGHVDYLIHTQSLIGDGSTVRTPVYVGLGVRGVNYDDHGLDFAIGPRVPVGMTAVFSELPVSLFAEIAPAAEFDGDGNAVVTADAGVGARVWF